MAQSLGNIAYKANSQCEVCEENITAAISMSVNDRAVCNSQECRALLHAESFMAAPIYKLHFQQQAGLIKQKKAMIKAEKAMIAAADEHEQQTDEATLQHLIQANPDLELNTIPVLSIPSGPTTVEPLGQERRDNYRKHLEKVAAEAFQDPPIVDFFLQETIAKAKRVKGFLDTHPITAEVTDLSCRMCKGGCCTAGADTGLISMETVKRAVKLYGLESPAAVVDFYLDKLGSDSVGQSCINHGPSGCFLESDMRSDICNGYYCESIKEHHDSVDDGDSEEPTSALVFRRGYDRWSKYEEGVSREIQEVALITNGDTVHL